MRTLHGREAVYYLASLKRDEFQTACRFPIGQRVNYYTIQTDWIREDLNNAIAEFIREESEADILSTDTLTRDELEKYIASQFLKLRRHEIADALDALEAKGEI